MDNDPSQPGPGGDPGRPQPYGPAGAPPPPGGAYGDNPYGGAQGAVDPLAGMPPLGSLPRRVIARAIDFLIVGIPVAIVMGLFTDNYSMGYNGGDGGGSWGQQVVYLLVYFVYEGLMLSSRGQTVGKMAMGIRVAELDNGAVPVGTPGWKRAATYSLPQLVPLFGFLFWLLNVLFCTWDRPYRQCLHDKVARTVVVAAR